jgi:hypothetical protein
MIKDVVLAIILQAATRAQTRPEPAAVGQKSNTEPPPLGCRLPPSTSPSTHTTI